MKGFAETLCPVPIDPAPLPLLAAKEVLVIGLREDGVLGKGPVGITVGFQTDPPLIIENKSGKCSITLKVD